ncbi:MAG: HAD family phosphatase [Solobacterium sp.]|nr:HAD family phosphatase [Solobacterium sp.]
MKEQEIVRQYMEPVKLVLCDIDGTLYDWDRILSDRTIRVINELHEKGYGFGIASGRPYEELVHHAKNWGFEFQFDVLIGLNGAELYVLSRDELFEYYRLSRETLKKTVEVMSQFDCNPFMYWHGKLLSVKMNEMTKKSARTAQREIVIANDVSDLYAEENFKIMFRMTEEETKRAEAYLAEHPDPDYTAFKTQSTLIEFMDPRISKGFTVRQLKELGEYEPEEILAFGDTTNDNDMLALSGWGVCLSNGSSDTKAIADDITRFDCKHDGFADYIETYLFRNG